MLRLNKRMFYAVEAVLYIAYNNAAHPVSSKEIAKRQGLPARYLEQIMQQLVKSDILKGIRGPKGGYRLNRERGEITVADICKVVNEMDSNPEDEIIHTPFSTEVTLPLCRNIEDIIEGLLQEVNIESMCEAAEEANIPKGFDDFAI